MCKLLQVAHLISFTLLAIGLFACARPSENRKPDSPSADDSPNSGGFLERVIPSFSADNESCTNVMMRLVSRAYQFDDGPKIGVHVHGSAVDRMDGAKVTIPEGDYTIEELLAIICKSSGTSYVVPFDGAITIDEADLD